MTRLILPFPETPQQRKRYIDLHLECQRLGKKIPHFEKNGNRYYIDNKGYGKFGFNNLSTKLCNESNRRGAKLQATPKLSDYIQVFGEDLGKFLHKDEQLKLKKLFKNSPPDCHLDHIHSLASGGVHHTSNLMYLHMFTNMSEGARILSHTAKEMLQLYDDPIVQISVHRVRPSDSMIRKIVQYD